MWPYRGHMLCYWSCYGFVCWEQCLLCLPRLVEERTLIMGIVLNVLAAVVSMGLLYVRIERETQYFGSVYMSSIVLLICKLNLELYYTGFWVKKGTCCVVSRLFDLIQECTFTVSTLLYVGVIVISSAYDYLRREGMSEVYVETCGWKNTSLWNDNSKNCLCCVMRCVNWEFFFHNRVV